MLFNSLHFFIFLPIVTALYFAFPQRERRVVLLLAGFYFYAVFSWKLCWLMVWSTGLDYVCARCISRSDNPRVRKAWLIASLTGNLGTLAVFKYLDFFSASIAAATGAQPWPLLHLVLPMGISFYTFQAMSYTIDVYRRRLDARTSILDFALYVTFFPHLVAGPIMRGGDLLPQFHRPHVANAERMLSGLMLVIWGLLKKVFVADPIGHHVDQVFGADPQLFSGATLLAATYGFAVQIYCDFSAYTDIAIGSGRILGFRVAENFARPYLALTIRDFWRRWHISLSHWLRDYLFVPLGGSRGSAAGTYANLMLTMLLGGLWHGASWTFVIWGGLHGLYLVAERMLKAEDAGAGPFARLLRWAVTFHLVCLAWVFFRSRSAEQALAILGRIVSWAPGSTTSLLPLGALALLLAVQMTRPRFDLGTLAMRMPLASRWVAYACIALLAIALASSDGPEFIYFQF